MHVSQILRVKGDLVFTARPHQTGREVAALLHERQVGALVIVSADDKVAGIVSERDIVRTVAQGGSDALDQPVSECMTRDVLFARPDETVDSLLERMTDRRIRHLPVCEGDRLIGLVSIGDLVKWKIAETEEQAEELKAYIAQG